MANRYWVGGTGNWSGVNTTNWSATSGGSGGASTPTAADSVFFDGNSNVGTGAFTVTVAATSNCLDLNIGTVGLAFDGVMTLAGTLGINIAGNLSLVSTNLTYTATGALIFTSTTVGKTITTNGKTLTSPITFSGIGGAWALQDALATTGVVSLTGGTLSLGSYTLTAASFASSASNTRSIDFGTGNITITGSGIVWNTATVTGFSYTGTPTVNISNNSATAATITAGAMTEAQALNFNIVAGTYALTLTTAGAFKNLNFTGFNGTFAAASGTYTIYGNLTIPATGGAYSATAGANTFTFASTSGISLITTNGRTINFGISVNGAGNTVQLADALVQGSTQRFSLVNGTFDIASYSTALGVLTVLTGTHAITNGTINCASVTHTSGDLSIGTGYLLATTGTYTLTAGSVTINNGINLSVGAFNSNSTGTRSIAFGTGSITVTGSGTAWLFGTPTNFSYTGTPTVNISNNSEVATTITTGALTAAQALNFNFTTGTYALTSTNTNVFNNLSFVGFAGSVPLATNTMTVYGNITYGASTTSSATTGTITLAGTSAKTITTNGAPIGHNLTINGVAGTYTLQDAFTGTAALTLTAGTLALGTYSLTVGAFASNGALARTLDMGTNTEMTLVGSGTTVWNTGTLTNLTLSPLQAPNIILAYSGSVGTRTINSGSTRAGTNAFNFRVSAGTDTVTFTAANTMYNINFTGFSGTWANVAISMYGYLTLSSTMTVGSGTGVLSYIYTGGSRSITSNGKTLDFPITLSLGTTTPSMIFNDTFTQGSTRAFTLTNCTLNLNSQTVTVGILTILTGDAIISNGILNCASVTHTSGTVAIGTGLITTSGTYTFTAGTITINSGVSLTVGAFSSSGTGTRSVAFGAGSITVTGSGTAWNTATVTNFSYTGTPTVNISNDSATATTLTVGAMTAAQALNFDISVGTYALTITTGSSFNDLDFTGFSGSVPLAAADVTVYGNITYSASTTSSTTTGSIILAGITAKTITTNGAIIGHNLDINGVAGTYTLQDALTCTGTVILLNGTFALSSYSFTAVAFVSTGTTARTLDMGTNTTLLLTGSGITVWNTATTTNLTVTPVVPLVKLIYAGSVGTRTISAGSTLTEANAFSFWISAGADTVTFLSFGNNTVNNLDFTGFSGTWSNISISIYGNLTLSSTMTVAAGSNEVIFAKAGGTTLITSNGRAINFPINFNGASSTFSLADNFSHGQATSVAITLTNGTLDFNGKTAALRSLITAAGTKSILFNGSTLTFIATATAFNNAAPTGFTTSAGTGVGTMSFNGASGTFETGGSVFAAKINIGAATTINGGGTFDDITNSVAPVTVTFQSGSTFNFNSFSLSGTSAVNMVTLANASTTTRYTLNKIGGGTVLVSFCEIRRSNATGGTWRAPTNFGNINSALTPLNTGWDFSAFISGVAAGVRNFFSFF